jgi:biopolymer transport protein ExbD
MRITSRKPLDVSAETDMTPMIDMTFQLIAFLMVMINFSDVDQHQAVKLPKSELARTSENPLSVPITLHIVETGEVILGGQRTFVEGLRALLNREADALAAQGKSESDATIVIRGHKDCPAGKVQEIIKACQDLRFDKFVLRAEKQE